MKIYRLGLLLLLFPFILKAQEDIRCGTTELLKEQVKRYPATQDTINAWNAVVNSWIATHKVTGNSRASITIPVVIHLVYNPNSNNNVVSDWQVQSQIDVINEDMNRLNGDAAKTPGVFKNAAANCDIHFCLAKRDPNGNPTTGILREFTSVNSWDPDLDELEILKHLSTLSWPKNKYLNVWVCNLGGGVLGLTTFPPDISHTDGIVVADRAFGRIGSFLSTKYNLGRTLTHELGHWLNAYHIWGDDGNDCSGSDYCGDTPNQRGSTTGCPSFPHVTCSDTSDIFMNFLDYSYDSCMNTYTVDQNQRFQGAINTYRSTLGSSNGCNPVTTYNYDLAVINILNPSLTVNQRVINPVVTIANLGSNHVTGYKIFYQFNKHDLHEFDWNGTLAAGHDTTFTLPALRDSIRYNFFIAYVKGNNITEQDTVNNFSSKSFFVDPNAPSPGGGNDITVEYDNSGAIFFEFDPLVAADFNISGNNAEWLAFDVLGRTIRAAFDVQSLTRIKLVVPESTSPGTYFAYFKNGKKYVKAKFVYLK